MVGFSTTNFTRAWEPTLSWNQLHSKSLLPNEQEPFSYLTLEVGKFARNARKHSARPVADDLLEGSEQFHVLAVALATDDMTGFGCAHRSQNVCDVWRVLVSRFNRTDAFRNRSEERRVGKVMGS